MRKQHWTLQKHGCHLEDGSLSAQFEHTVLVTRDGCEVLTAQVLTQV